VVKNKINIKPSDSLFSICNWQYALFRTRVRTIRNCSAAIKLFGTVRLQSCNICIVLMLWVKQ